MQRKLPWQKNYRRFDVFLTCLQNRCYKNCHNSLIEKFVLLKIADKVDNLKISPAQETQLAQNSNFCAECKIIENNGLDEQNLVLQRSENYLVILNKKPFNAGHLLIIPTEHSSCPLNLKSQGKIAFFEQIERATNILQKCLNPHGFNIGLNLGKAAGAKNTEHFCLEIVPRWTGDANFMASVAQTKPISSSIVELYKVLKSKFDDEK